MSWPSFPFVLLSSKKKKKNQNSFCMPPNRNQQSVGLHFELCTVAARVSQSANSCGRFAFAKHSIADTVAVNDCSESNILIVKKHFLATTTEEKKKTFILQVNNTRAFVRIGDESFATHFNLQTIINALLPCNRLPICIVLCSI